MQDTIRTHPDTGLPAEEMAWHLAVSDRVKEHLSRGQVTRAFGRYLDDPSDDPVQVLSVDRGGVDTVAVQIEYRNDGGFSMTLVGIGPAEVTPALKLSDGHEHHPAEPQQAGRRLHVALE